MSNQSPMNVRSRLLEDLTRHVRGAGVDPAGVVETLTAFVDACHRYARLEKLVLGAVPLQFPAHLLMKGAVALAAPLEEGLRLAALERKRLELSHGPVEELAELIEEQGLKVIEVPLPPDCPILGAFIFDSESGPAILADATLSRRDRDYALAHEYGHFLADHDPFETWICLKSEGAGCSEAELRAHAFASAFLVAGEDLEDYLRGARLKPGDRIEADILRQLRTYFDAADRAITGRMLVSGWLKREEVGPLMAELRGDPADPAEEPAPLLTRRRVGLAVLARRTGRMSREEMASQLGIDEEAAGRIEESFAAGGEEESPGYRAH